MVGTCASSCPFHSGIPFSCVDEDLYLPSNHFVGTVDKMVQLAHNHSAKSINTEAMSGRPTQFSSDVWVFIFGPLASRLDHSGRIAPLVRSLGTLAMIETALTSAQDTLGTSQNSSWLPWSIPRHWTDLRRQLRVFPPPLLSARDNFCKGATGF